MPGLTIATNVANTNTDTTTTTSPHQQHQRQRQGQHAHSRPSSPARPPVSPITPTLGPTTEIPSNIPRLDSSPALSPGTKRENVAGGSNDVPAFAQGRPAFAHPSQQDQLEGLVVPPAPPIAFDDNPDVLAIKSAISILQLQRARAQADMQALKRAKEAALANPAAFVADLASGQVGSTGDPLLGPDSMVDDATMTEDDSSSSGSSAEEEDDSSSDESGEDQHEVVDAQDVSMTGTEVSPQSSRRKRKAKGKQGKQIDGKSSPDATAWRKLPKPQTVVRCPPINWAQYGIVGESLDKLHAEQLAAPTLGAPIVLGPGGTYEFKAGDHQSTTLGATAAIGAVASQQQQQRLVGIAAPYTPGKDKLDSTNTNKSKKTKGGGAKR
ncbi:hypothetical protein QBC46DRAFT_399672 [Diplogelasinospora grovesii]|uniref:Uncharacterized protein n=1 Tax=Diplogelasinospora grovesii TaxID=303347 RepID=A0AAN6MVZ5_9PEZI|nr:hypothetical protein QBC46DRAFT_399672 [Diplogelasinospora grovesii]